MQRVAVTSCLSFVLFVEKKKKRESQMLKTIHIQVQNQKKKEEKKREKKKGEKNESLP